MKCAMFGDCQRKAEKDEVRIGAAIAAKGGSAIGRKGKKAKQVKAFKKL